MPEPTIILTPGEPLPDAFGRIPSSIRDSLARGFIVLKRFKPADYPSLVKLGASVVDGSGPDRELRTSLALGPQDLSEASNALALAMWLAADEDATVEGFIDAASGSELLDAETAKELEPLLRFVKADGPELRDDMFRSDVAQRTLPSFSRFYYEVDIRIGTNDAGKRVAVPVAVAYLGTDTPRDVWFQMSRSQAARLHADLTKVVERLDEAAGIAADIERSK